MTKNRVVLSEVVTEQFKPFWRASKKKQHLRYVLKGGRGSGKSFHIPMRILMDIMEYPVSAVGIRKVQNTILKSIYANFKAAANVLGVRDEFRFVDSRLEITYKRRGNKIYFIGADDPEKIKSIKDADFPLAIAWFEELAEFKDEDGVTTIENSILREELEGLIFSEAAGRKVQYQFDYCFYYSYNPPKRKQSWVNKKFESVLIDSNTYIHHSTYLGNPHLSKKFFEEADNVKAKNEMKYRWEYLGEPIGSGVVPFTNLQFEPIPEDMLKTFDNVRQGIDWGYGNDPFVFLRLHYDKKRRRIYIFDELYGVKLSSREITDWIKKKGYTDAQIKADSEEPRSISEFRSEFGIRRIVATRKGPGSVEHGEKWLDELEAIVIDPKRCPNTAREFENIDYAVDKDGNPKNRLDDKNNHSIDTTRYALEDDMIANEWRF
ncbi:MAG: PBSX family phage terminase large subunit [Turicibacter sp.]|nr:PBSX family phage terminase large subunit [Turicibacter sp.]